MAYSSYKGGQNRRRPSSQRRPQNRNRSSYDSRQRSQGRSQSRSRNGSRSGSRSRNLTGPDTGYTLHSHRVNYNRRGATMGERLNGRVLVLIVLVIVVIVVLVAGIASCVSNNASSTANTQQDTQEEEQKPRVASGISSDLTQEFNTVLDRNDQLAQIAQNADQYDDERLLRLALREPEAISFVANYLTADKSGSSYGDTVTKGQVPLLYDWDARWGYVSYGDGCIGVTGSGPTTIAMAYMGLTGKSDQTPATIAQSTSSSSSSSNSSSSSTSSDSSTTTSSNGSSSSSSGTSTASDSADSIIQMMANVGLSATQYDSSSSTLEACLSESSVAAVYLNDNGLEQDSDAHWALVVGTNDDGTLNVFDPTSTEVSTRTWDSSTVANASSTILYVTVSETSTDETSGTYDTSTDEDETDSTSTTSSSGTSSTSGSSSSGTSSTSGTSGTSSTSNSSSGSGTSTTSTSVSDDSDYVGL